MKKNNKGFTLIELLAVIVILTLILTMATPAIGRLLRKNKEKAYNAKVDLIIKQAIEYAKDDEEFLYDSSKRYNSYVCNTITVSGLVSKGYLDAKDNDLFNGTTDITDPRDKSSMMNKKILIYIKSKYKTTDPNYSTNGIYVGPIVASFENANSCS